MSDTHETAVEIVEQFSDHLDLDVNDVEETLENVINEYNIQAAEAARILRDRYQDEAGLDDDEDLPTNSNDEVLVNDINAVEEWVDVRVQVDRLWDSDADAVGQTGLVGDESGLIQFTSWAKSNVPEVEVGKSYLLENVVTDVYEGDYNIKLNSNSSVTELDEDIEIGNNESEYTGVLVDLKDGSGLIKRCPEDDCTRVLEKGNCQDHGSVDNHVLDIRLKAVLDDGHTVQNAIFDAETTEELTDISLEDAKELAQTKVDPSVVADKMEEKVLCRRFRVSGPEIGRNLLVNDWEIVQLEDGTAVATRAKSN